MEKYNMMAHDANTSWNNTQQPWGGMGTGYGFNNPRPGVAEPLKPKPEEEPSKEEEEPSKKKKKKNLYEITC